MNSAETSSASELKADVVIVGAGAGGLSAAVAAAESGVKNIIVLETRRAQGGNAAFAVGIFAAESVAQKRLGIDASKDELFKKAMRYAHWIIDPRLVRSLVNKSGDTIGWLEGKGVNFAHVHAMYANQVPQVFHFTSGTGGTGAAVVKALIKNCEELGVRFILQTRAKKLLTSNKGVVTGVLAESKHGEIKVSAKSVIIATGGFAGNSKLMKKHFPNYNDGKINLAGLPHKGDGMLMAAEVGAANEEIMTLEMSGPKVPVSWIASFIAQRPTTLWVNRKGERFTDEAVFRFFAESANTVYRQPGKVSYTLLDERIKQSIIGDGLKTWEANIIGGESWPGGVDKELQARVDVGMAKISDSWNEISKWMEVDPKVLNATIDEYNRFCDQGYDEIFVKERRYLLPLRTPPFYAIKCGMNLMTTHGGIKVNHHMQVIDREGDPIQGLYAAGVDVAGTDSDTYNADLIGHSFGFSLNGGRIAGESAAERVKNK